jgi:hypothetical protein
MFKLIYRSMCQGVVRDVLLYSSLQDAKPIDKGSGHDKGCACRLQASDGRVSKPCSRVQLYVPSGFYWAVVPRGR